MALTVLTLSRLGHVLAIRSERDSLFAQSDGINRPLPNALVLAFSLQITAELA